MIELDLTCGPGWHGTQFLSIADLRIKELRNLALALSDGGRLEVGGVNFTWTRSVHEITLLALLNEITYAIRVSGLPLPAAWVDAVLTLARYSPDLDVMIYLLQSGLVVRSGNAWIARNGLEADEVQGAMRVIQAAGGGPRPIARHTVDEVNARATELQNLLEWRDRHSDRRDAPIA